MHGTQVSQLGPFSNGEETSFDRARDKPLIKGENCSARTETTPLNQEITVPRLALTRLTPEAMRQSVENITPHYMRRHLQRTETVYHSWPLMQVVIIVKI